MHIRGIYLTTRLGGFNKRNMDKRLPAIYAWQRIVSGRRDGQDEASYLFRRTCIARPSLSLPAPPRHALIKKCMRRPLCCTPTVEETLYMCCEPSKRERLLNTCWPAGCSTERYSRLMVDIAYASHFMRFAPAFVISSPLRGVVIQTQSDR